MDGLVNKLVTIFVWLRERPPGLCKK